MSIEAVRTLMHCPSAKANASVRTTSLISTRAYGVRGSRRKELAATSGAAHGTRMRIHCAAVAGIVIIIECAAQESHQRESVVALQVRLLTNMLSRCVMAQNTALITIPSRPYLRKSHMDLR